MDVILNIGGWEKVVDIDPSFVRRGDLEVALHPPMDILIKPCDRVPEIVGPLRVRLFLSGYRNSKIPVFKYR